LAAKGNQWRWFIRWPGVPKKHGVLSRNRFV